MRNKILGIIIIFAVATNIVEAQLVKKLLGGDSSSMGITYSLPQTAVSFKAKATVTNTIAGDYAPYAEKYLGLKDVAVTNQTVWEIKDITLDGRAIPDNSRVYQIEIKGDAPKFYLSDDGLLLSINREPDVNHTPVQPEQPIESSNKIVLNPTDVLNEEILKAGSKAKQAELIAREIFSIRENRRDLLRGDVESMPKDGLSFQLVLDNLEAQEKALLSLFIGTTTIKEVEREYTYIPSENIDNKVLFRFSSYYGFVDSDDLVGEPYYLSINILDDKREKLQPEENAKKKIDMNNGIAYNVPGKARIKLVFDGETICGADMLIAQLGYVAQLPLGQFTDKKKTSSASFTPLTGSIKIYE